MTAVEREFRLGKSVVFGTLDTEYNDAYDVNITGGPGLIILPKGQGWIMRPLPFEFPTKKNALIEMRHHTAGGSTVYVKSSDLIWTDTYNGAGYGEGWFSDKHDRLRVIFEGED